MIGCDVAAATGAHVVVVVLMGMATGVFGGLLRDILWNQVPLVLRRDLYATVALAIGILYLSLMHLGVDRTLACSVAIGAGFAFRLLALRYGMALPVLDADTSSFDEEPGAHQG